MAIYFRRSALRASIPLSPFAPPSRPLHAARELHDGRRRFAAAPESVEGVLLMVSMDRSRLVLSLNRALLGAVHPQLRQASIEADDERRVVVVRFEYDGEPSEKVWESCSIATAEVIADHPEDWGIDDQHVARPFPERLESLAFPVYRRAEPDACV